MAKVGRALPDNQLRIALKRAGVGSTLVSVALESVLIPCTGLGLAIAARCGL